MLTSLSDPILLIKLAYRYVKCACKGIPPAKKWGRGNKLPINLFHSYPSTTELEQWLNRIREHVWVQMLDKIIVLPSRSALHLQWLRTVWIVHMWVQLDHIKLLIPEQCGWSKLHQNNHSTDHIL